MLCRLILSISILFSTVAWAVDYGDRKIGVVTVAEQPGWLERESGTTLESNMPLVMLTPDCDGKTAIDRAIEQQNS